MPAAVAVIDCVAPPGDDRYDAPFGVAVNVVLSAQMGEAPERLPESASTTTVVVPVAVQPVALLVTVTGCTSTCFNCSGNGGIL